MGEPGGALRPVTLRLRSERTRGTETSQYPEEEKSTRDAPSSGERTGPKPKPPPFQGGGVVGPTDGTSEASRSPLERGARDGESPVGEGDALGLVEVLSSARHEKPGAKPGGPPSKAEDSRVTDSGRVP
jgi:hypothetical protein